MDSITARTITEVISITPSWPLIVLVGIVGSFVVLAGIVYFAISLSKNTTLTSKIFDSVSTIEAIRADQIKSNEERKSQGEELKHQGEEIKRIAERQTIIEKKVEKLTCANDGCPNRNPGG